MNSWRELFVVQVGGIICLPVLAVGYALGSTLGWASAFISVAAGVALLLLLGFGVLQLTKCYREDTPTLSRRFLGRIGAPLFYVATGVKSLGWFAIQLSFMAICLTRLLPSLTNAQAIFIIGGVIALLGMSGLRGITRIAQWSLPAMLVVLVGSVWLATGISAGAVLSGGLNVGLVIGTSISAVLNLPTFFEKSRTPKDQKIAFVLSYGIALPLVEGVGIYLGVRYPGSDAIGALTGLGGSLWQIFVAAFLLIAGWTTNNVNLYSAGAAMKIVCKNPVLRLGLAGVMGVGLSFLPLLDNFGLVLDLIGAAICAFCGVMVAAHLLSKETKATRAYTLFWGAGTAMGLIAGLGIFSLTGIPLIDALGVSGLLTVGFGLLNRRGINAAAS